MDISTHRRSRTLPALLLGLLTLLFLAACSPASTGGPSPGEPGKPKYGGTFTFFGQLRTGLDEHRATSIGELEYFSNLHGFILEQDTQDRQTIHGDLAESWQVSPDGKTYTFKLRSGLKTHKGKPFTAEDIAYNIQRMTNPPNKMPIPRGGCIKTEVKGITVSDPTTFSIQLGDPVASFAQCLANPYIMMQPKYVLEALDRENRQPRAEEVDGVGPYVFEEFTEGSLASARRFDGYYKPGLPYMDKIQMVDLPDASSQIAAFRTQRLDQFGAFAVTPRKSEAESLKKEFGDRITIDEVLAPGFRGFMINWKRKPLDDVRVREAIDLAADRQNQLDLVLEGKGTLSGPYYGGWDWIYSFEEMSKWPGYRKDKAADLARARQLLAEAGYGNGLTVDGVICGTDSGDDCDVLVDDLRKAGIELKLSRGDSATNQSRGRKGDFSLYYDSKAASLPDPDEYNSQYYLPDAGFNWPKWEDAEFLRLYQLERVEQDQKKRGEILRKMADIVRNSHAYVFTNRAMLHQTWWSYVRDYVAPTDFYQVSMRRDQVWLDK